MRTFEDIAALWKQSGAPRLPVAADIIKKATREKTHLANKILFQACCMLLAIVAICFVMYFIKFQYLSSYLGIAVMFLCVIVFASIRFRQARFLRQADFSQPPAALVSSFEKFHHKQQWVNSKGVLIYTILLNIGFVLYFYETLWKAPLTNLWRLAIFAVYVIWMLVATLWIGRRSAKREHMKTQQVLDKLKSLQSALGPQ